jgi:hypothetical protein
MFFLSQGLRTIVLVCDDTVHISCMFFKQQTFTDFHLRATAVQVLNLIPEASRTSHSQSLPRSTVRKIAGSANLQLTSQLQQHDSTLRTRNFPLADDLKMERPGATWQCTIELIAVEMGLGSTATCLLTVYG